MKQNSHWRPSSWHLRRALPFALGALIAVNATPASAQISITRDTLLSASRNERGQRSPDNFSIELWAGLATNSPRWGMLGATPRRNFAIASLRFGQRIARTRTFALNYTMDVVPFAQLSPARDVAINNPNCGQCSNTICEARLFVAGSSTAIGMTPIGLQFVFRPDHRLQLRAGASGGMLWFSHAVPSESATRFNFTAIGEAGVQYVSSGGNGVNIAYRLHHISNAGIGASNPGIASQLLSLGIYRRLSR